ncbi:MAG: hypothetical protein AAFV36_06150 [Myxococcota bacterium]
MSQATEILRVTEALISMRATRPFRGQLAQRRFGSQTKAQRDIIDIKNSEHHDALMRSTLTLDPDVAEALKAEQHRTRQSFKAVVNTALRRGLSIGAKPTEPEPFRVEPMHLGFQPGIDPNRLNQLLDELDVDDFLEKANVDAARRPAPALPEQL